MPKPFQLELSDDERQALERVRISIGARSLAEAIRRIILSADDGRTPSEAAPSPASKPPLQSRESYGFNNPKPGSLLKKR